MGSEFRRQTVRLMLQLLKAQTLKRSAFCCLPGTTLNFQNLKDFNYFYFNHFHFNPFYDNYFILVTLQLFSTFSFQSVRHFPVKSIERPVNLCISNMFWCLFSDSGNDFIMEHMTILFRG